MGLVKIGNFTDASRQLGICEVETVDQKMFQQSFL